MKLTNLDFHCFKQDELDELTETFKEYIDERPDTRRGSTTPTTTSHQGLVSAQKFEEEIDRIRNDLEVISRNQRDMMDRFKRDMNSFKSLLQQVVIGGGFVPGT